MTKIPKNFLRYAVSCFCLSAWRNGVYPSILEVKEALEDDPNEKILKYNISKDIIDRFLPESNFKVILQNIPGIKLIPHTLLRYDKNGNLKRSLFSGTLIAPSDVGLVKAFIDKYEAEADLWMKERKLRDPEFRKSMEDAENGSPVFNKIWEKILKFKGVPR